MRLASYVICLGVACVFAGQGLGQTELLKRMAGYQRDLRSVSRGQFESYLKELEAIEAEAVAEEDYETAWAARKQYQDMEAYLCPDTDQYERFKDKYGVVLDLRKSSQSGVLSFDPDRQTLKPWKNENCDARWNLRIPAGTYHVEIKYSCGKVKGTDDQGEEQMMQAGGILEFSEMSNLAEAGRPLLYEVEPTEGWDSWRMVTIGAITVQNKSPRLRLKSVVVHNRAVMELAAVRLIPVRRPALRLLAKDWEELAERYRKAADRRVGAIHRDHIEALKELLDRAEAEKERSLAGEIKKAIRDAEKAAEDIGN